MTRAALYIRVSSDRQAKEGDSIPAQREALRQYVAKKGYVIAGEYIDDGISGTKYSQRDELQRLLSDVQDGQIDIILFTKLDRWFRSIRHYMRTQDILDRYRVGWLAIWEPIYDTTTPQGRLIVNQMLSIAQFEAENTGQRVRQVFRHKVAHGEVITGKHPAGFRIADKHLVLSDDADIVREAFEYYSMHGNIADTMRHYAGRANMPTSKVNFMRMLKSPFYKGEHPSGVKDYCPAIVSAELWDDVQRKLAMNVKKSQKQIYIFSGLIRCAECGKVFGGCSRIWRRQKGDVLEKKYRCTGRYARIPRECCNSKTITETAMEKYLLEQIPNIKLEYEIAEKKRVDNTAKIRKIERKLERLKDLYVEELIDLGAYKTDRERLLAEMDKLSQETPERSTEDIRALLRPDLRSLYETFTEDEKRFFWRGVVKEIRIDSERNITVLFA